MSSREFWSGFVCPVIRFIVAAVEEEEAALDGGCGSALSEAG
jgi:hypothetical protein